MESSSTEKYIELLEIIDRQAEIIKQQREIIKKALIKNLELENYIAKENE